MWFADLSACPPFLSADLLCTSHSPLTNPPPPPPPPPCLTCPAVYQTSRQQEPEDELYLVGEASSLLTLGINYAATADHPINATFQAALAIAGTDPLLCDGTSLGSVAPGAMVVVSRGGCSFAVKAANVQAAGGAGMMVVDAPDSPSLDPVGGWWW